MAIDNIELGFKTNGESVAGNSNIESEYVNSDLEWNMNLWILEYIIYYSYKNINLYMEA